MASPEEEKTKAQLAGELVKAVATAVAAGKNVHPDQSGPIFEATGKPIAISEKTPVKQAKHEARDFAKELARNPLIAESKLSDALSQRELDINAVRKNLESALATAPSEMSWISSPAKEIHHNALAAELATKLITSDPQLQRDPYYLLHQGTQLYWETKWAELTPEAHRETRSLLNAIYRRIQELAPATPDFQVPDRLVIQALLPEARTGGMPTQPSPESKWKLYDETNQADQVTGSGQEAENLRSYLRQQTRRIENLRLTRGNTVDDIEAEQQQLAEILSALQDRVDSTDPNQRLDPHQTRIFEEKLNDQIIRLGERKGKILENARAATSRSREFHIEVDLDSTQEEKQKQFFDEVKKRIDEMGYAGRREQVLNDFRTIFHYQKDAPPPDFTEAQEYLNRNITQEIRRIIHNLEMQEGDKWTIKGFSSEERELGHWLSTLQVLDPDTFKKISLEEESRNIIHALYKAFRTSESPYEFTTILREMAELDDTKFLRALIEIPGVSHAYSELDKEGLNLMAHDNDAKGKEEIFEKIAKKLEGNPDIKKIMIEAGVDGRTAVDLAYRFFVISFRDAWWYNAYLEKMGCLIWERKDGHWQVSLKPNTPLKWRTDRIVLAPQAIVAFFRMGGDLEGQLKEMTWKTYGLAGGKEHKAMVKLAEGVGADIFKAWLDNGGFLGIRDLMSRRNTFYTREAVEQAWTEGKFLDLLRKLHIGEEQADSRLADRGKALRKKAEVWDKEFNLTNLSGLDDNARKAHELYREYLKQEAWFEFSKYMGTQVEMKDGQWKHDRHPGGLAGALKDVEEMKGKINPSETELHEFLDKAAKFYREITQDAETHNTAVLGKFGDAVGINLRGFLPSMEQFDLRLIPWDNLNRGGEWFRGQMRDTRGASALFQDITNYFSNATPTNLLKIQKEKYNQYENWADYQNNVAKALWVGFNDAHKAGLFGMNPFENSGWRWLHDRWASKWSRATGMKSLSRLDFLADMRAMMYRGEISRDQFNALRGGWWQRLVDYGLENFDPMGFTILVFVIIQEEAKKVAKEAGGE